MSSNSSKPKEPPSRSLSSKKALESAQKPSQPPAPTQDVDGERSDYEDASENVIAPNEEKKGKFVCKCAKSLHHAQFKECVIQRNWDQHVDLVGHLVATSVSHIPIAVTEDEANQKVFIAHEDLFAVHSGYFRRWLKERRQGLLTSVGTDNAGKPTACHLKWNISEFSFFMAWLYTGSLLETLLFTHHKLTGQLWDLGAELEAPGFQNSVMELIRTQYGNPSVKDHYMRLETIKGIYTSTKKGALKRTLAADIMAKFKVPNAPKFGLKEDWDELINSLPDLKEDYDAACKMKWKGNPWVARNRSRYMVEERDLDEMWEECIRKKDNASYEEREKDTDVGERLEFAHLKMMKEKKNGKAKSPVE